MDYLLKCGVMVEYGVDGSGHCFYLSLRDLLDLRDKTPIDMRLEQVQFMLENPNEILHFSVPPTKDATTAQNLVPLAMSVEDNVKTEHKVDLKKYAKWVVDGVDGKVHEATDIDIAVNCR